VEIQPESRDLLLALLGNDLDGYARQRLRLDQERYERNVVAFMDEFLMRRVAGCVEFAPGVDWRSAKLVIEDLLWDIHCGRTPAVSAALRQRTQSESDVAWASGSSMVLGSLLPAAGAYFLLNFDPFGTPFMMLLIILLGPMSVVALAGALRSEKHDANRIALITLLSLNAAVCWLATAPFILGVLGPL
jgi:hypothetical protein